MTDHNSNIDFDYQDPYHARVYRNSNYLGEYWNSYEPKIFSTKRSNLCTESDGFGVWKDLLELSELEDTDIIIECEGTKYKTSSEKYLDEGSYRSCNGNEKVYLRPEQLEKIQEEIK